MSAFVEAIATASTADVASFACVVGFVLWPFVEGIMDAVRWVARRMA